MKECRYCSTPTHLDMKIGRRHLKHIGEVIMPCFFCSEECKNKYVVIKGKIKHQKKMDNIYKTPLPTTHLGLYSLFSGTSPHQFFSIFLRVEEKFLITPEL